jgi:hypothetical protein
MQTRRQNDKEWYKRRPADIVVYTKASENIVFVADDAEARFATKVA